MAQTSHPQSIACTCTCTLALKVIALAVIFLSLNPQNLLARPVLSEVLADPEILPDSIGEFLEWTHIGTQPLDMVGSRLDVQGKIWSLPPLHFEPGEAKIFCRSSSVKRPFSCEVPLPGFQLSNGQALAIRLADEQGDDGYSIPASRPGIAWVGDFKNGSLIQFRPQTKKNMGNDAATPGILDEGVWGALPFWLDEPRLERRGTQTQLRGRLFFPEDYSGIPLRLFCLGVEETLYPRPNSELIWNRILSPNEVRDSCLTKISLLLGSGLVLEQTISLRAKGELVSMQRLPGSLGAGLILKNMSATCPIEMENLRLGGWHFANKILNPGDISQLRFLSGTVLLEAAKPSAVPLVSTRLSGTLELREMNGAWLDSLAPNASNETSNSGGTESPSVVLGPGKNRKTLKFSVSQSVWNPSSGEAPQWRLDGMEGAPFKIRIGFAFPNRPGIPQRDNLPQEIYSGTLPASGTLDVWHIDWSALPYGPLVITVTSQKNIHRTLFAIGQK